MVTLYEILKQAETEGSAIGHFNVSDLVTLKAVFESARDQNVPVVVGVSGRNEMDPPLCGSTVISHNEFQIREPIEPQEASPMKQERKRNKKVALTREPRMRTELHFVLERVAGFTPRPHRVEE